MADLDTTNKFQKSLECRVAESITEDWRDSFLYDHKLQQFIMLDPKTSTWFPLESTQVIGIIRTYLNQTPKFLCRETTKLTFYGNVAKHLKLCQAIPVVPVPGIMTQTKFFNFLTGQAEERSHRQFCFNYIDQPFEVGQSMDPEVVEFLKSLCNYNNLQLHVLRHFFKCTLLGENPSQIVLLMMGPGPTGKSTFAKMLMSIIKRTSCSLELNRLSGRLETSRILGKQLLVLGNVNPHGLTSQRASLLKLLSNQEPILGERKHQNTVSDLFKGTILIHGNSFFKALERAPKDSTRLARRVVKFPCNTVPATLDHRLPIHLERNLIPMIWWALTSPLPPEYFLGRIPSLNEILDEDVENEMRGFILDKIYVNEKALTPLGAQKLPPRDSLYAAYKNYCTTHHYEACSWSKFGNQFLITIRSLRVQVHKFRKPKGLFLAGVSLTEGRPLPIPDKTFGSELMELMGKDPFER